MIQFKNIIKSTRKGDVNWAIDKTPEVLKQIDNQDVNIAIYERNISNLTNEINQLVSKDIKLNSSGDIGTILKDIKKGLPPNQFSLVLQDIHSLLLHFSEITGCTEFRLLLATINNNMCRKFHTDINDLRMLCTYSGPGTLWLTNDNINQEGLRDYTNNTNIVLKEKKIKQAKTGAVVVLKGAMYPQEKVKAIVHRSPTIEESGERRLLLRIDTNTTLNF